MKRLLLLALCSAFMWAKSYAQTQPSYFPPIGDNWDTLTSQETGFCKDRVQALYDYLNQNGSRSFVLLKDGKIALEHYMNGFHGDSTWPWFSAGKSLTSVLVGIAQFQGYLSINDKSSDYLGDWSTLTTQQEDKIKIYHHITMTTGLDESDFYCTDSACLVYKADPGTRWYYHNAPYSLVRKILENATGKNLNVYTKNQVSDPIGMKGLWVPSGYNNFFFSNARTMARFGLMVSAGGVWDGDTIIHDRNYFNSMKSPSQALNPAYGYLWWLNGQDSFIPPGTSQVFKGTLYTKAPQDSYFALGANGQIIGVFPTQGYILVRQGAEPVDEAETFVNEVCGKVMDLLCPVSVDDKKDEFQSIQIRPNPAGDIIHVNTEILPEQISITDIRGRTVLETRDLTIRVGHLVRGTYFVRIRSTDGNTTTSRLILQ